MARRRSNLRSVLWMALARPKSDTGAFEVIYSEALKEFERSKKALRAAQALLKESLLEDALSRYMYTIASHASASVKILP